MEIKQNCAELFRDLDKRVATTNDKVQKFMFDYAIKYQTLDKKIDNHNIQLLKMCEILKQYLNI